MSNTDGRITYQYYVYKPFYYYPELIYRDDQGNDIMTRLLVPLLIRTQKWNVMISGRLISCNKKYDNRRILTVGGDSVEVTMIKKDSLLDKH